MKIVRLGEVAKRANTKEDKDNTDRIYYAAGEHIIPGELRIKEGGLIEGSTIGPMFYFGFKAGQLLLHSRSFMLKKAAVADFDGICSEKVFVLETIDSNILLQEYLPFVVQNDNFWEYAEENKSGSVNFFLNWDVVADYEFELPSIEEQRVLADKLWAAYELKEAYKKMIVATDEMVKSQFIEMFEGDKYPSVKLSDIASEWLKGQSFRKDDIVDNGNSMCIHYGELFTKYGPIINQVLSRTNVEGKRTSKVGDILFPASDVTPNGLARCSMLPYDNIILGGDIIVLRPKRDCNAAYLSYAINQQTAQLLIRVNGAVVKHMSAKALMTVVIPMPPLEEQNRFVSLAQQADKSKFELRQAIDKIDKVMKSLLQ